MYLLSDVNLYISMCVVSLKLCLIFLEKMCFTKNKGIYFFLTYLRRASIYLTLIVIVVSISLRDRVDNILDFPNKFGR